MTLKLIKKGRPITLITPECPGCGETVVCVLNMETNKLEKLDGGKADEDEIFTCGFCGAKLKWEEE